MCVCTADIGWFFLLRVFFLISPSSSNFSSSSLDPHTVSAARHWITSWWGVCLLRASYEFFISMPSKFPCLPKLLIISCFFLSFHSFTLVCLTPPNKFYFSLWCTGFISFIIFRDRETILHAWLELKHLSRLQTNTPTQCLSVDVCLNMTNSEF